MIAQLTGTLKMKSPEYIVLDVHGVGYGLAVTLHTYYELPEIGVQTTLYTYTHVREDTLKLYGFLSWREKGLFEQLININKIGPKLARNILSKLSAESLTSAILQANAGLINSIPGVGDKTAQRLILELKDKLGKIPSTPEPQLEAEKKKDEGESLFSDAVSALINLGYSKRDSQQAVRSLLSSSSPPPSSLKDLIKLSLDRLSG